MPSALTERIFRCLNEAQTESESGSALRSLRSAKPSDGCGVAPTIVAKRAPRVCASVDTAPLCVVCRFHHLTCLTPRRARESCSRRRWWST